METCVIADISRVHVPIPFNVKFTNRYELVGIAYSKLNTVYVGNGPMDLKRNGVLNLYDVIYDMKYNTVF